MAPALVPAADTVCDDNAITRPYASVVITGIVVALPTVVAPGPVDVNAIELPVMVKLPVPLLVLTTRVPESYTAPPYMLVPCSVENVAVPLAEDMLFITRLAPTNKLPVILPSPYTWNVPVLAVKPPPKVLALAKIAPPILVVP